MIDNKEICSCCGQEFDRFTMQEFNLGRRKKYLCQECYKAGDLDARIREIKRGDMKRKEKGK